VVRCLNYVVRSLNQCGKTLNCVVRSLIICGKIVTFSGKIIASVW